MGSGASIHVEPYLDNDTASLSDQSTADDESMDTAFMTDESDSENESFLSNVLVTFTKGLRGCFGHFYKSAKCFINVLYGI